MGEINSAIKKEKQGEQQIAMAATSKADELMTVWENSLEESPMGIKEWRDLGAWSWEDLARYDTRNAPGDFEKRLTELYNLGLDGLRMFWIMNRKNIVFIQNI